MNIKIPYHHEADFGGLGSLPRVSIPENFDEGVGVRIALSKLSTINTPSTFEKDVLRKTRPAPYWYQSTGFKFSAVVAAILILGALIFFSSGNKDSIENQTSPVQKGTSPVYAITPQTENTRSERTPSAESLKARSNTRSTKSLQFKQNANQPTKKSDDIIRGGKVKKDVSEDE